MSDSVADAYPQRVKGYRLMQRTGTRPTILLIEDYDDSRQILKLLLEGVGYTVLAAANGNEALSAISKYDLDLVLTDFDLPDMTGASVIRYLREHENGSGRIPVIVLTAVDAHEYRELAVEAGCDAFLFKPTDFQVLQATLERLLAESKSRNDIVPAAGQ